MSTTEELWTPSSEVELPKRWSLDAWGGGGSGKSHFVIFTAPGPLYYILLDMRDPSPLILKSGRKDIFFKDLRPGGVIISDKQADERLTMFNRSVESALKAGEGTLAIDGGSVLSNLLEQRALAEYNKRQRARKKDFQDEDKLPALQRGAINSAINDILAASGASGMNFVITHQQKEVWADLGDGKGVRPTGEFDPRENSQIEYGCDMSIRLYSKWVSADDKRKIPAHMDHAARITRCKINESVIKMTVSGKLLTWKYLVSLLLGDQDEDD